MKLARRVKKKLRDRSPANAQASGLAVKATAHTSAGPSSTAPKTSPDDSNGLGVKIWCEATAVHKTPVDIVFVHGLTGKRTKTWLADEAEEPWPKTLLHSDIAEARIMTYGYDADVVNFIKPAGQNTVREHARNFNYDLTNLRRKTSSLSRPLIFVAHSLGGLVCQQACILAYESLEADHQLFDSLVGIMFLGTPHSGSGLAKFALALGFFIKFSMVKTPNNSNLAILKRDSEVLAAVQDSFGTLLQRRTLFGSKALHIHCCIEEKPVPILGARVVEPESARFPGYCTSCTIPADHMGMTRFSHPSEVGYERVSGKLREWTDSRQVEAQSTKPFLIPFTKDDDFVGREDILKAIDVQFTKAKTLRRVALAGLGGIGKTQIAIEYAHRTRQISPDTSIFWVNASNASRFAQSYRNIGLAAKIPGIQDPTSDVLQMVSQWLSDRRNGTYMMILDNADDKKIFFGSHDESIEEREVQFRLLAQYLPQSQNVSILLTSRDGATAFSLTGNQVPMVIKVETMSEEDAMALLAAKLSDDSAGGDEVRRELNRELDFIPLAITQASAYISQSLKTVEAYLKMLRRSDKHEMTLLNEHKEDFRRYHGLPNSVLRTWQISFERIKDQDPNAADLLALMSMFDRQNIPRYLLHQTSTTDDTSSLVKSVCKTTSFVAEGANAESFTDEVVPDDASSDEAPNSERSIEGDLRDDAESHESEDDETSSTHSLVLEQSIAILQQYSLIKPMQENDAFSMHRLVQLATKTWVQKSTKLKHFQSEALESLYTAYPSSVEFANWAICETLDPHVQMIIKYKFASEDDQNQLAWLLSQNGYYAQLRGDHDKAEKMVQRSINIYCSIRDLYYMGLCHSLNNLALIYSDQDRLPEALKIYDGLLARMKPRLEAENEYLLSWQHNLAVVYGGMERYDEQESLLRSILEIRERTLPPEHEALTTTMGNLGSCHLYQDHLPEAEKLLTEVLRRKSKVLGASDPSILTTQYHLALTYAKQGRLAEAEHLMMYVWKQDEQVHGVNHPNSISSLSQLAIVKWDLGQRSEAIKLLTQATKSFREVLGHENPYTLEYVAKLREWESILESEEPTEISSNAFDHEKSDKEASST